MATRFLKVVDVCPKCKVSALNKNGKIVMSHLCDSCKKLYWSRVYHKNYLRFKRRQMVGATIPLDGDTRSAYELVIEQLSKRKAMLRRQYYTSVKRIDLEIGRIKQLDRV